MRAGDWAAAWALSDEVLRRRIGQPCLHRPRHEQWIWDGRPLAGKRVLVRCYHGLGDTVQFIRFLPRLRALARETIVWAQPVLHTLLRTAAGIDRLLPLHDGTPDAVYDAEVELMELPHVFRATPATLPHAVPYLHAPTAHFPRRPGQLAVGLAWQSGAWDPRRSVPKELLGSLGCVAGVEWFSLQRPPAVVPGLALRDVSHDAPERTAASMRALDLVISVDSFPAHLAGALGVPVWTLLHAAPDWRWMDERDDSPWYPTMRLFRQPRPGDWASVIADVITALRQRLGTPAPTTHPLRAPSSRGKATYY
jgi:hypothetical protein